MLYINSGEGGWKVGREEEEEDVYKGTVLKRLENLGGKE